MKCNVVTPKKSNAFQVLTATAGRRRFGWYSPDLGDLRASLADDAAYELVGHRHLVSL